VGRRASRLPLRARLTLLYGGLFALATLVVLAIAYAVLDRHLARTLPDDLADAALRDAARDLALTFVGILLLAGAAGWWAAGRALRPIGRVTAAARRVSEERLDERLALGGPRDEVRELADTFDAMLDRLAAGIEGQRRFVANAGHELRTPLTALRTELEVALDDPAADAAALRATGERALGDVDELERLLESLLALARARRQGGGPAPLRREPVDLADLARRAAAPVADPPAVELDAAPAPTTGDPVLLGRLVANLLDNACRYNRPDGWVRLESGADGGEALLRIVNSGPRIAPEDLARLTEPFERLGRHAGERGHGLGLAIVAAVADAHGGDLRIAAPAEGGLDVVVRLPAAPIDRT